MGPLLYRRAAHAADALRHMATGPDARYLGGGTGLVDLMRLGVERPGVLIDVRSALGETIVETPSGGLRIAGAARNSDVAAHPLVRQRFPMLATALLSGASPQIRNAATIAGNLLQRTRCPYFRDVSKPCNKRAPGSGCPAREGEHRNLAILGASPACVATHPSDAAVALTALEARVWLRSGLDRDAAERVIGLDRLYRLPGDDPSRDTTLPPGALLTAIELPPPGPQDRTVYRKVTDRASFSFGLASIAAVVQLDGDRVRDSRLVLGAVAHTPWCARAAEAVLRGARAERESFVAAADAELAAAQPLPGNSFKVKLMRGLLVDALDELTAPAHGSREA